MYLLSHLRGRKHQSALAALPSPAPIPASTSEGDGGGGGGGGDDGVIIDAPEEHQGPSGELLEIQERLQAGKKKSRKLRQRMNAR